MHKQHHPPAADAHPHAGHDRHAGHSVAKFRDKFWLTLALTIPVVVWSPQVQHWLHFRAPTFPGSSYLPAILGTVVFFYGGLVFLRGARTELADRKPGMMSLISLAILVAFGTSIAATLGLFPIEVWWELASLITIMLLGHWMEMRAIASASGALQALSALLPDTVERLEGTQVEVIPLSSLHAGDLLLIRPGGRVPADGVVVEGEAEADEALLTGESQPVAKSAGAPVRAGSVIGGGSLRVRAEAVGAQTALSGIERLVAAAQASSSRAQALADRAAGVLFYVAVAAGAATFLTWWFLGDREAALLRTATVLVIACPHALGLAIPLVIAISTSLGARHGLLVKDRLALERARELDVVIFDKTGTLTRGTPAITDIAVAPGVNEAELLRLAAAVESSSEHPLARAVVAAADRRGLPRATASNFEALPGRGARARVGASEVWIGAPRLLAETSVQQVPELERAAAAWSGRTVLFVVVDGAVQGMLAAEDEIRPESAPAIAALHRLHIRVAMITGDARAVAESVARRLGLDEVVAEVLPAGKAAAVAAFQRGGRKVGMVGDGVNDAPALATADVGIAIGAGTDVAIESAGIVLVRNDPGDVVAAIALSRASYRKMVQNLVWATAYNVVAIPVAAGVFVRWGVSLPMSLGAVAMSLSTIIVAVNAQLLRRLRLRLPEAETHAG